MRNKALMLGLALLAVVFVTGCESGAKFRVVNRTSYPLYVQLEGFSEVIIPGSDLLSQSFNIHEFDIDTETQNFFTGTIKETRRLKLIGETFHIYDDVNEVFKDSTVITIKAGKNLDAYISPNRASIKIVNNSSRNVLMAEIYKHNFTSELRVGIMQNIESGSQRFMRMDYATNSSNFYYYVRVTLDNGNQLIYGGTQTVMQVDQQLLIVLEDPL